MYEFFAKLGDEFYRCVIRDNRWMKYLEGLGVTLQIALGAVIIGILIGSFVAIMKVYAANNRGFRWLGWICDLYITVIRGVPMVLQLLIAYFVIFTFIPQGMEAVTAMIAFGINSGAYVAEIVRAGINAVDRGQTEAGRSLGLSQGTTMRTIVFPQAIKNILPALGNELIVLVKETAVVGYIGIADLTRAADLIRSRTFVAFMPLIVAAVVYLILVMLLSWGLRVVERRLARSDNR